MDTADNVGVDEAPRTTFSELLPDCFPVGFVLPSDDVVSFNVKLPFCQLGHQFRFLLSRWLNPALGWSTPCNFSKDVARKARFCRPIGLLDEQ